MSYSYRQVRTDEYRRLQNAANSAQRLQSENASIRANAAAREREINTQHQADLNSLNRAINIASAQASAEVRQASTELRSELARQSAQQQRELQSLENRVSREINRVDANIRAVDRRVNEVAAFTNERFAALERAAAGKQERANLSMQLLADLLETVRGLRPEKFTPGELAALLRLQSDAQNNINNGDTEAAISTLESGVREAGRLASRLTFLNNAFDARLREVRTRASEIQERLESFAPSAGNTIDFTMDGQEYHFDYDISYWAGGRFQEIAAQFGQLAQQLEQAPTSNMDLDGLELVLNDLNRIDQAITACDTYGRDEMIRSTVVEDMAIRIHNVLADRGWTPRDTGHTESDDRKPYEMVYADGSGNEVAIVVGGSNDPKAPNYMVNVYSESEFARDNLFGWLSDGLRAEGVNVPVPEHCEACEKNPTAADFARNVGREVAQAQATAQQQSA